MPALEPPAAVRTTCPYCGVGCGVLATVANGRIEIRGDPEHPANFGRLCSKGAALAETLGHETRLLHPEIGGRHVSWDAALDHVAAELQRVRDRYGPQSIAFYLSGQLLTEDYYVANKLAKGFIGTPHVDTNSRLCMASSVAGHRRAFGADVVPQCYDDVELADLVVLVGSNTAWCHPILYQRMQVARGERGMRIVNIDPRRTATSEAVDLQLSIAPGSDIAFWNGLLIYLSDAGRLDWRFISDHTEGFAETLAAARQCAPSIQAVAAATGLDEPDIERCYGWWAETPRVVSCYSQGVNQSVAGTDTVNAIINCHLATGRIGNPGAGPLSLTGQPNAMGGREVGGLANQLAAHMGFAPEERERVRRFWSAPNLVEGEGYKAVQMFDAVARGEIKALWVMGTNPAVSLPQADRMRDALGKLELFVMSENVRSNDTVAHAHVRLPAAAWGEKDGTVTNSERRISRQRAFLPPAGEARADWWIMSRVAQRLGWRDAFNFYGPADVFREHADLSGYDNAGARAFDISALREIGDGAYHSLAPVQWPLRDQAVGTERLFADGRFFTASRRACFVPVRSAARRRPVDRPFILNTGRVRDQWHTMTRTGLSPRLSGHIAEPFVEIHPDDAARLGLAQGTLACVETDDGSATLRVLVNRGQQPGSLFAPIHWSAENASSARIGALVHGIADPVSGQPDSKATPASVSAVAAGRFGVMLSRTAMPAAGLLYWARARFQHGHVLHFATAGTDPIALPEGDTVTVEDTHSGIFRAAVFREGRLEAVALVSAHPTQARHDWLETQFARDAISDAERRLLLSGRPVAGYADQGPIVCVCFQIGRNAVCGAVAAGASSTSAVGKALGAGTNCGSCIPEIARIIATAHADSAVAAE